MTSAARTAILLAPATPSSAGRGHKDPKRSKRPCEDARFIPKETDQGARGWGDHDRGRGACMLGVGVTYLSITWATPFLVSALAMTTVASLIMTVLPEILTVTEAPLRVGIC